MADILPKAKLYLFMTVILVIINIGIFIARQTSDLTVFISSIGTSFVPFAGLILLFAFPQDMPIEFLAFAGVIVGIFSGIVTWLLFEILWSHLPLIDS